MTEPTQELIGAPKAPDQTGNTVRRENIEEGDWVKILDASIARLFDQGRAKVVYLLGKEGETQNTVRAFIYGRRADRKEWWLENEKSVPVKILEKIETPEEEIKVAEPTRTKKRTPVKNGSQKSGTGGYVREPQRVSAPPQTGEA